MTKIYTLTQLGRRLARSTNNPDTPGWKIVHYLDSIGYQTPDQIASGTGIGENEVATWLGQLRRRGIVTEATGVVKGGF